MELTNISVTAGDSDAETPPRSVKATGFSSYTNGAFKRRHCVTAPPPAVVVSYRECMRNHAAGIGGHALDGCCEFMPSQETDSGSLRCAACGCHRNFHRRDPDDPAPLQLHCHRGPPPESAPAATRSFYSGHHVSLKKTFSGSDPATISPVSGGRGGRKRFRTRFSQEQKEKMYEFAEKLGWKLQRIDKRLIEEFCSEIGVGKEVLKVWMHNNKNTLGRREISGNVNGGIIDGEYNIAPGNLVTKSLAGIGNGNGGPHNGDDFKPVVIGRSGDGSSSSSG
ncbi:hypothetical protein V2J09_019974 [Rumex salicifolius]